MTTNNTARKVLYFMPDNPLKGNAGNATRSAKLLQYFSERGFETDFVSEYHWGQWNEEQIAAFRESGLAREVFVLKRKPFKRNLLRYVFGYTLPNLLRRHKFGIIPPAIPDYATGMMQKAFNNLLRNRRYDYIIISYATWANLLKNNRYTGNAYTIIDTHDFITAHHKSKRSFRLGPSLEEEIKRLNVADEVWSISVEEQYIFSQFCSNSQRFVPPVFSPLEMPQLPAAHKQYDLIYVASENINNRRAATWFFDEVYPLLPKELRLCVIGRVNEQLPDIYPNVSRVPFAPSLQEYYAAAKVAICPMLAGTGIKIKVIEALAHGVPVVSTTRGMDGFPDKSRNGCLVSDEPAGFAAHIMALLNDTSLYVQQQQWAVEMLRASFAREKCYAALDAVFGCRQD